MEPEGLRLPHARDQEWLEVEVPRLEIHTCVRVAF
jgi:hypothetical protein